MLKLRTATTLARVPAEKDERRGAVDLLAPLYDWFTEGFGAPDLKDAKAVLDQQARDGPSQEQPTPGVGGTLHYADILRLKGWMLGLNGDLEGAERNFLVSIDWARRQKAKSWELRTSTSLARLWQSQGTRQDAYELLAPVYGWFTEGFDTKDLLEAKSLLAELG